MNSSTPAPGDPVFPENLSGNPASPTPLADAAQRAAETARQAGHAVQQTAQEWSHAAREKSADFVARQGVRINRNPSGAVVQALLAGLAVGILLRLLQGPRDTRTPRKVDVARKPTLEETKFHLGSVLLPFLWPIFQTARRQYARSAEAVQGAVDQVQETDFRKLGRKSAEKVEQWMEDEIQPIAQTGWKKLRQLWD